MDAPFLCKLADIEQQFQSQEALEIYVNLFLYVIGKKDAGDARRFTFKLEDGREISVCICMYGLV